VTDDARTPADVLCDLLLYAPLGFAFEARRLLPELAERGRNQVNAARYIGEFAVKQAGAHLGPDLERVGRDVSRAVEGALGAFGLSLPPLFPVEQPPGSDGTTPGGEEAAAGPSSAPAPPAADEAAAPSAARPDAAGPTATAHPPGPGELPIPDYDSLAASQVVPRLASLDVDELEAVKAYEAAKRARRTILNRVEQLLEQRRSAGR